MMTQAMICSSLQASGLPEYELGGKASQMAWLSRNGLPVPDWCVVTTAAFRSFLAAHDLTEWLITKVATLTPANAAELSEEISRTFREKTLPEEHREALAGAIKQMELPSDSFFAVRSSVVGEDAENASFAGQMDSFLFRRGMEAIEHSILAVWASAFSERALLYRLRQQLPLDQIQCAVIVQRMIDGQASGVLFTAHPVTGRRDQALISACWGTGEGLVSGICAADEFAVDLEGNLLESQIATKDIALVFDRDEGIGTCEQPVPEADQDRPCLSPEQCRQIIRLGHQIARSRRSPQDIEWTYADGQLWLLQTRPITALPAPAQARGNRTVWDNSNIQESYCGVTTPLTFSFARRAYATVYEQTMRILGLSDRTIESHRDMLDNMLGLIRGRVYYNINNWYRGLTLLPAFSTNKSAMERMMGLQDPVDFIEDQEATTGQKLRRAPTMARTLVRLLVSFARMEKKVGQFHRMFESEYGAFPRDELHTLEFAELMDWAKRLDRNVLEQWTTPILNDFYVMMSNNQVHQMLTSAGVESVDSVQNNLMSGEEGIESTEPTKFLLRLTDQIRQQPDLLELVRSTSPESLMDAIQAGWPDTYAQCQDYIERYGDRTMGELKLESVTLRADSAFMFSILKNFLSREDLTIDRLASNEQAMRQEAETRALDTIRDARGSRGVRKFRKALRRLRSAVKYRENMRLARTRLFGLYRDLYQTMGERLHEAGMLHEPRDIFYVSVDELDAWMAGTFVGALADTAAARKAVFAEYENEELPHHFFTYGPVYHHNDYSYPHEISEDIQTGSRLKGIGCYPGVVEQPVRLIFSPKDELSVDGQILCTVRTDPGWAPLFPTAGGLLIERGSTLSHSAVVARELGIPAVVNVPGITQRVRNGERVRIDGSTGEVHLLDQEDTAPAQGEEKAEPAAETAQAQP